MAVLLARPRKGPLITRKLSDYSLGIYAPADRPDWQGAVAAAPLSRTGIPVIGYMPDILYAPELDYLGEIEPGLRATVRSSSILAQRRMIAGGAGSPAARKQGSTPTPAPPAIIRRCARIDDERTVARSPGSISPR